MSRSDLGALAAVLVATAAFSLSMRLRELLNPWSLTTAAALTSIVAVLAARPHLASELARWRARGALVSAVLGVALVLATHGAYRLVVAFAPALSRQVDHLYAAIDVFPGPVAAAPLVVVVVLAEELVWRGLVVDWLATRFDWPVVAALSVASYAAPQIIGGSWILVVAAIALGMVFVAQRLYSRRLTDPLVSHAIWSLGVFSAFPL